MDARPVVFVKMRPLTWTGIHLIMNIYAILAVRKIVSASVRDTIELAPLEENPGSVTKDGLTSNQKTSLLQLHNAFRSIVKPTASNMLRMVWDDELETIAANFASKCLVAHNPDRHKQAKHYDWVGENIAWGTGLCGDKECGDVFEGVKRWFSESKNYNFITGQCSGKCTLYTQMSWWESNKLGCGAKRCGDRTILVCNYAPGGNYVGQKPYRQGKPCTDCPKGSMCDNNLCVPLDQQGNCRNCLNRGISHERQGVGQSDNGDDTINEAPLPQSTNSGPFSLPGGWMKLPVHLIQIDSGTTPSTWGLGARNTPYLLEVDNVLTQVNGTLHHVSAGGAGVWGIGLLGNIFLRMGVTEEIPRGLFWEKVRGNLKQIDSGPPGIVWGVNRYDKVFCRIGISAQNPPGTGWRLVAGELKYISCGSYGCWGVDKQGTIFFRKDVTPANPQGNEWVVVQGSLRMVESGPNGVTVGIRESSDGIQDVLYRSGVTAEKPEGTHWVKMDMKLSHVTVGQRGIMGIMHDGTVVIHRDLKVDNQALPLSEPEGNLPTMAAPLENQNVPTMQQTNPTRPTTMPVMAPTPAQIQAAEELSSNINQHLGHTTVKAQEKDPMKLSPELTNKILDMIQQKGNEFEALHKAAAQAQRNTTVGSKDGDSVLPSPTLKTSQLAIQNSSLENKPHEATAQQQAPMAAKEGKSDSSTAQQNILKANKTAPESAPVLNDKNPPSQGEKNPAPQVNKNPLPSSDDNVKNAPTQDNKNAPTKDNKNAPSQDNKNAPTQENKNAPSQDNKNAPPQDTKNAPPQGDKIPVPQFDKNPPAQGQQPAGALQQNNLPQLSPTTKATSENLQGGPSVTKPPKQAAPQQPPPQKAPVQPAITAAQQPTKPTNPQPSQQSLGKPQAAVQQQQQQQQQQPLPAPKLSPVNEAGTEPNGNKPTQVQVEQKAGKLPQEQQQQQQQEIQQELQLQKQQQQLQKEQLQQLVSKPVAEHPLLGNQPPTLPKPTLKPTQSRYKAAPQLATATRPENMHHVAMQPTIASMRATPFEFFKNKQNGGVQHFQAAPKNNDDMYDIGLLGRKHLNEVSNGINGITKPTQRATPKPIRTAPVTQAVTVSYELTRSCCAIPDSVCPIPRDCTGYIECKGYKGFYKICERGKMFHPFKNICDFPRNVDCENIKVGGSTGTRELRDNDVAMVESPPLSMPNNVATQSHQQQQQFADSVFFEEQPSKLQQNEAGNTDKALAKDIPQPRISTPGGDSAGVLREVWFGLGLSPHLKDLIKNPRFPETPDEYLVLDKFEAPPNAGDGYGQRLSTYYKAPESGDYTFTMACDNECELWISSDTDELKSKLSIELKNGHFTSFRQWDKFPDEQNSRPVNMEQGKYYFIESFMKEGTGGDNLSIGVRLPGGKREMPITNNLFLIPVNARKASSTTQVKKSERGEKPLESADAEQLYNSLPLSENYLDQPDRVTNVETDSDIFNARKRTSV